MSYHCTKCDRQHVRGKIHTEHASFAASPSNAVWSGDKPHPPYQASLNYDDSLFLGSDSRASGFVTRDWSDTDDEQPPRAAPEPERRINFRLGVWEWDDKYGERYTVSLSPLEELEHAARIAHARGERFGWWQRRKIAKRLSQ